MDSPSDRHIVQIFSADGTQIFATILAINNYRFTATGKTVMLFSERPADAPDALKAWFYPNNNWGQEFVYPKRRAIQLAVAEKEPVPALTTDTLPVEAELKTAPIIAVTPEQKEVPVADGDPDRSARRGEYESPRRTHRPRRPRNYRRRPACFRLWRCSASHRSASHLF